jgi:copper chaperone
MKPILMLLSFIALTGCAVNQPNATLKVSGMSCEACAMSVTNNLKKIDGVNDVKVEVETGTVEIFTKENSPVNTTEIQKMIDLSGYKLNSIDLKK